MLRYYQRDDDDGQIEADIEGYQNLKSGRF